MTTDSRSFRVAEFVACSSGSQSDARAPVRAAVSISAADDAMGREAVRRGHHIALFVTASSTSFRRDPDTHNRLVPVVVHGVADEADVIVLAKTTMARVLSVLTQACPRVPVLAGPQLALAEVGRLILPDAVDAASGQHEV